MIQTPYLIRDTLIQRPEYYQILKENIQSQAQPVITVSGLKVYGHLGHICKFTVTYLFDKQNVLLDSDYVHPKFGPTSTTFTDFLAMLEVLKEQAEQIRLRKG